MAATNHAVRFVLFRGAAPTSFSRFSSKHCGAAGMTRTSKIRLKNQPVKRTPTWRVEMPHVYRSFGSIVDRHRPRFDTAHRTMEILSGREISVCDCEAAAKLPLQLQRPREIFFGFGWTRYLASCEGWPTLASFCIRTSIGYREIISL